jgi:hypothetical protein
VFSRVFYQFSRLLSTARGFPSREGTGSPTWVLNQLRSYNLVALFGYHLPLWVWWCYTRDSHSDDDGEGEHDETSVEEASGTMVNIRVPTEQSLSGCHHSVIPQVGQETPLQSAMHSPFFRFPKPEKLTGKSTDSNEVENWIFVMDNLFVAQGNFLTESQKFAYAVGFLTDDALTWWLAERISPDAPHALNALRLALLSYFVSPVKVSDAKDRLLSLNQKNAEGIGEYVSEF